MKSDEYNTLLQCCLSYIQYYGEWEKIQGINQNVKVARRGNFIITILTPFLKTSTIDIPSYQHALLLQNVEKPLGYLIDVYFKSKKCFSIEWDGQHSFRVRSVKKGDWTQEFLDGLQK